ncbi:phosphopantetheine-binding protein [Streptomyces sp. NBC_01217]|nr:phosphopantetheine-binding protein [Streptomyces sp. NBC_01217]
MWNDEFDDLLRQFLPYIPPDEQLTADTALRDAGLDSLGTVQLLAALEDRFDVRFKDDALTPETFETPGALWQALSTLLNPVE